MYRICRSGSRPSVDNACVCSTTMSMKDVLPWCRWPQTATLRVRLGLLSMPSKYSSLTRITGAFASRTSTRFVFSGAMMGSSSGCASSSMTSVSVPSPYTSSADG